MPLLPVIETIAIHGQKIDVYQIGQSPICFAPKTGCLYDPIIQHSRKPGPQTEASRADGIFTRQSIHDVRRWHEFSSKNALYDAIGRYRQHIEPYYRGKKYTDGEIEFIRGLIGIMDDLIPQISALSKATDPQTQENLRLKIIEITQRIFQKISQAPAHCADITKMAAFDKLRQLIPLRDSRERINPMALANKASAIRRILERREQSAHNIPVRLALRPADLWREENLAIGVLEKIFNFSRNLNKIGDKIELPPIQKSGIKNGITTLCREINDHLRVMPFFAIRQELTEILSAVETALTTEAPVIIVQFGRELQGIVIRRLVICGREREKRGLSLSPLQRKLIYGANPS